MDVIIADHIENLYKDLVAGNGEDFAFKILNAITDKVTDTFIAQGYRNVGEREIKQRLVLACKLARELRNDHGFSAQRVCDVIGEAVLAEESGKGYTPDGDADTSWGSEEKEEHLIWMP